MRLRSPATLKALMGQYNFSLARLARYADCSKGFISHLLSGRRSSCTPVLAARIAEALNVPLEVLFDPKASPTGMLNDKEKVA
jgi:transcriptional regulator with XRE-family HTH domain